MIYREPITTFDLKDFGIGGRILLRPLVETDAAWEFLREFSSRHIHKPLRIAYSVNALFRWMTDLGMEPDQRTDKQYTLEASQVNTARTAGQ